MEFASRGLLRSFAQAWQRGGVPHANQVRWEEEACGESGAGPDLVEVFQKAQTDNRRDLYETLCGSTTCCVGSW